MARVLFTLVSTLLVVAACSDEPLLRDFYWGKSFIQSGQTPGPVPRDEHGNAVIDDNRRDAMTDPAADPASNR